MASKKNLKKDIKKLTGDLMGECLTFGYFHQEVSSEKIGAALDALMEAHNEIIARINAGIYDKKGKGSKAHFQAIIQDVMKMPDLLKFD